MNWSKQDTEANLCELRPALRSVSAELEPHFMSFISLFGNDLPYSPMTTDVLYVSPSDSIDECMTIMSDNHIRHLPVLEEEKLVAVISIGDVVKHIIKLQKFQIRELEKYIKGGYRL